MIPQPACGEPRGRLPQSGKQRVSQRLHEKSFSLDAIDALAAMYFGRSVGDYADLTQAQRASVEMIALLAVLDDIHAIFSVKCLSQWPR